MNKNLKCTHKDRIRLDLISGSPNWAVALGENGGTRISACKLWGFGHTEHSISVSRDRLRKLIEGKEKVTLRFIEYGDKGVFLDDTRISANGTKTDFDAYVEKKREQQRLLNKCWSKKRYRALMDNTWFVIQTKDIAELL